MAEHAVVIAGAGPTGLMLAGELALAGVDVAIAERRTGHGLVGSRAGGMTPRTIEVLDQRGIADRFLSHGATGQNGHYSGIFFDVADLPTRHNYGLGLLQHRMSASSPTGSASWACQSTTAKRSLVSLKTTPASTSTLSAGPALRASYLVGCDGGRSLVRKTAGIPFPGWDPSTSCLVADVEMTEEPPWGLHRKGGLHSFFKFEDGGPVRVMVTEPNVGNINEPALADIGAALIAARGTDILLVPVRDGEAVIPVEATLIAVGPPVAAGHKQRMRGRDRIADPHRAGERLRLSDRGNRLHASIDDARRRGKERRGGESERKESQLHGRLDCLAGAGLAPAPRE